MINWRRGEVVGSGSTIENVIRGRALMIVATCCRMMLIRVPQRAVCKLILSGY